jgi:hypothetical protein
MFPLSAGITSRFIGVKIDAAGRQSAFRECGDLGPASIAPQAALERHAPAWTTARRLLSRKQEPDFQMVHRALEASVFSRVVLSVGAHCAGLLALWAFGGTL